MYSTLQYILKKSRAEIQVPMSNKIELNYNWDRFKRDFWSTIDPQLYSIARHSPTVALKCVKVQFSPTGRKWDVWTSLRLKIILAHACNASNENFYLAPLGYMYLSKSHLPVKRFSVPFIVCTRYFRTYWQHYKGSILDIKSL